MTSGFLPIYEGNLTHLLEVWQGNTDTSRGDAGEQAYLSSFHSDIGIPINYQEESGIVTFRSTELRVPLEVSKGCEASCPDEADA